MSNFRTILFRLLQIVFIKAIFDNGECKYFYAYKDASRQLKIDKGSIRYAFKFKNGRCDKIKATFVKITEEEYKNKTKNRRN